MNARISAGKQRVFGIPVRPPVGLCGGMIRHAAPRPCRCLVHPFRNRDILAVVGGVAFERDKALLLAGERLHRIGLRGIGVPVDTGVLATAKDDEIHYAGVAKVPSESNWMSNLAPDNRTAD